MNFEYCIIHVRISSLLCILNVCSSQLDSQKILKQFTIFLCFNQTILVKELFLCRNFSDASQYVILYFLKVKRLLKEFVIKLLLLMRLLWFLQPRTLASFSTGDLFIIETEYQDVRCTLFCTIHFKSKGEKKSNLISSFVSSHIILLLDLKMHV